MRPTGNFVQLAGLLALASFANSDKKTSRGARMGIPDLSPPRETSVQVLQNMYPAPPDNRANRRRHKRMNRKREGKF